MFLLVKIDFYLKSERLSTDDAVLCIYTTSRVHFDGEH